MHRGVDTAPPGLKSRSSRVPSRAPTMHDRSFDPRSSSASRDYQRQRQMTLGDLLLENRIILLQGEIFDGNANELVMKLL